MKAIKNPEPFTVRAWGANAIAFIAERGLTSEFNDWCGGWPCPVSPQAVSAAPDLLAALKGLLANLNEGDFISETRIEAARTAILKAEGDGEAGGVGHG